MKNAFLLTAFLAISFCQAQLQELFHLEASQHHFSGTVLVKKGDQVVLEEAYGMASESRPITIHTSFDIGSISKQFTAIAILQLVKEGKLTLEDPINQHLGKLTSTTWKKVTVHHLLTHSSGIPSLYQTEQGLELMFPEEEPIPIDQLVAKFQFGKLLFKPGKKFSYSNSGYILLAAMIEHISGMRYGDYMNKFVFKAHGLHTTNWGKKEGAAYPYFGYRPDHRRPAPLYHPSWFIGAGGIYSTVADLLKWVEVIQRDDFLSLALKAEYLRPHIQAGGMNYGYGWQFVGKNVLQHDGGNAGFISLLRFDPESHDSFAILTNQSFEDIHMLGKSSAKVQFWGEQIWKTIKGDTIKRISPVMPQKVPHGAFLFDTGDTLWITGNDTVLKITAGSQLPSRILIHQPIEEKDTLAHRLMLMANFLTEGKFRKIGKYCDKEMKLVCYSGLLRIGFGMMKKKVGKLEHLIPYSSHDTHGIIRMTGTEGILDLIVYLSKGKVSGIMEHGYYPLETGKEIWAYPVGEKAWQVDGFPLGEPSALLQMKDDQLIWSQFGRSITGKKILVK